MKRLLLAFVFVLCCTTSAMAQQPTPLVVERYDQLIVVHEMATDQRNWEVHRVYFVRKGRVIADRILTEDMLWSTRDKDFQLFWNDYGSCHRLVVTDSVSEMSVNHESDYDSRGEAGPLVGDAAKDDRPGSST